METPTTHQTEETHVHRNGYKAPHTKAPAEKSAKRWIIWAIVLVAGIFTARYAYSQWHYASNHVSTDDAQVEGNIVPVLARVGGYVKQILIVENKKVAGNSAVVLLDDAELREKLAQAEAELAAAEAAASTGSEAQIAAASGQQAALQAQIKAARARQEQAEKDLERIRGLAEQHIVSQQQLDAAQTALQAAVAGVQALEQQAGAAGATVTSARSSRRMAEARVQVARSAVENARLWLSYARITAPVSGTVSKKQVEVGQLVQPGQPLMSIVADTNVWITANFKETDLARLHTGLPVEISVDAYPECKVQGRVESIGGATGARFALLPPDNATGNFTKVVQRIPVRIQVTKDCGAELPLRPGLSTVVHVKTR